MEHEQLVLAATNAQLRTLVLRPGCVYGRAGGLTAPWFVSALAGEVEIVGDGTNCWSTVHVTDLAAAYVLAGERAPGGEALNINDGTNPRVGEMVAAIAAADLSGLERLVGLCLERATADSDKEQAAHRERVMSLPGATGADPLPANARAVAALGWHPRHTSFASEADLYLAAYRAHQG